MTRKEKIDHLVTATYPIRKRKAKTGQFWVGRHPNAALFRAGLNERPTNVINCLYDDFVNHIEARKVQIAIARCCPYGCPFTDVMKCKALAKIK